MNQFLEAQKEGTFIQKGTEFLKPFNIQVNVSKIVLKEAAIPAYEKNVIAFLYK